MTRLPRFQLPGVPQHVIQRGNNRSSCFFEQADYIFYLDSLREAADRYGCRIHAYVLMRNHIHLLVTPCLEGAVSSMMQSAGVRYVKYVNRVHGRTGGLWEGRYRASLVESEDYMLACYRYIELNPVRAGIVRQPQDYPYSSYHANALGKQDKLVTPHDVYLDIGVGVNDADSDPTGPYRALFEQAISRRDLTQIRRGTQSELGIGQAEFLLRVAKLQPNASE